MPHHFIIQCKRFLFQKAGISLNLLLSTLVTYTFSGCATPIRRIEWLHDNPPMEQVSRLVIKNDWPFVAEIIVTTAENEMDFTHSIEQYQGVTQIPPHMNATRLQVKIPSGDRRIFDLIPGEYYLQVIAAFEEAPGVTRRRTLHTHTFRAYQTYEWSLHESLR